MFDSLPQVQPWSCSTVTGIPVTGAGIVERGTPGVLDLVEAQVRSRPEAPAMEAAGATLSYAELWRRAGELARRLRKRGVESGDRVAICLPKSLELPLAMLAAFRAGAAYVPLDPQYPRDRLAAMLDDAEVAAVVSREPAALQLPPLAEPWIDARSAASGGERSLATDDRGSGAAGLAYVMYTSGSTGKPKGVAMSHAALRNLLLWQVAQWRSPHLRRTLQFASASFDVSFQEIFATWAAGATLVVPPEDVRKDARRLMEAIEEHRIVQLFLPAAVLRHLAEACLDRRRLPVTLREIVTAGEQLELTPAVTEWLRRLGGCRLQNQYGPTETHVVTAHNVDLTGPQLPPIGKPLPGVQIELLGPDGESAEEGELYVSGVQVAQGYHGRPRLTTERFIPDRHTRGQRGYRTGDLARWLPDGSLEYLGRADAQLKIRGYRVEPGEVAVTLRTHPHIRDAAVVAEEDGRGGKRLVAAVVLREQSLVSCSDVQAYLRDRLPEFLVPARLKIWDRLPLTPNGKLDHRALCQREIEVSVPTADPEDALQQVLLRLYREILSAPELGIDDDFFASGGDSLAAMELVARAERELRVPFNVELLLQRRTVALLSQAIEQGSTASSPLVALQPRGQGAPFFCVHPAGGNALAYLPLARAWSSTRPLYGLQFVPEQSPGESVESLAASYIESIQKVQPKGPFLLGGWSYGGTVAYEMACQLVAAGEAVQTTILIDAGVLYSLAVMRGLLPQDVGIFDILRMDADAQFDCMRGPCTSAGLIPQDASADIQRQILQIVMANMRSLIDYRHPPYSGRVTLLLGREPLVQTRHDPRREWRKLCREVQAHDIPGNHLTLVREPNTYYLADVLSRCLDAAEDCRRVG